MASVRSHHRLLLVKAELTPLSPHVRLREQPRAFTASAKDDKGRDSLAQRVGLGRVRAGSHGTGMGDAERIPQGLAAAVPVSAQGKPLMGVAVTGEGDVPRTQCGPGDFDDLRTGVEPSEAGGEVSSGRLHLRLAE